MAIQVVLDLVTIVMKDLPPCYLQPGFEVTATAGPLRSCVQNLGGYPIMTDRRDGNGPSLSMSPPSCPTGLGHSSDPIGSGIRQQFCLP